MSNGFITNRWKGTCSACGGHVPAISGVVRRESLVWAVYHTSCARELVKGECKSLAQYQVKRHEEEGYEQLCFLHEERENSKYC